MPPAHHPNARPTAGFDSPAIENLPVAERQPGALPAVKAQRRAPGANDARQQRLIDAHVPGTVRCFVNDQPPSRQADSGLQVFEQRVEAEPVAHRAKATDDPERNR